MTPVRRDLASALRRPGAAVIAGRPAEGPVLVVRPRRVRVVAWVCAIATVVAFAVPAAVLRSSQTGVYFRTADQVSIVLLGVLIAAGILLLARPRARADARGVEVRNVVVSRYVPWEQVRAVSFPDGASWARLDLPHDEYVAVLAVQAVDGPRAVTAMRGLRALHSAAHTTAHTTADTPGGTAEPQSDVRRPDRP